MSGERAPKNARRTIKGSTVLTLSEKFVWLEDHSLDQGEGEGAYISSAALAERLGMGRRSVDRARARLATLGLHVRGRRKKGGRCWFSTLPAEMVAADVYDPDGVLRCIHRLDWHIQEHDEAAKLATSEGAAVANVATSEVADLATDDGEKLPSDPADVAIESPDVANLATPIREREPEGHGGTGRTLHPPVLHSPRTRRGGITTMRECLDDVARQLGVPR